MENKKQCSCENCFKPVVANNLCDMHYRRFKRHGNTDQARPDDWGKKTSHPLYDTWQWMKKMENRHYIEEDLKNFWVFVDTVGNRPDSTYRLHKINPELGYSKGNLVWKKQTSVTEDRAKYARDWRKANPEKAKNSELKKRFGITLEKYNEMRESQNYCCAICCKHETDSALDMAVDHCHSTGKVRGLLCKDCNAGLGHFKDNIDFLKSAIQYLGD